MLCMAMLSACTNDSEGYENNGASTAGQQSADSVNISLRVKVPTRANPVDEYYFHNEYTISSLYIYFFDSETKKLYTRVSISELTQEDSCYDTQYDVTYLFNTIRLHAGVYDIFVNVINVIHDILVYSVFQFCISCHCFKSGYCSFWEYISWNTVVS